MSEVEPLIATSNLTVTATVPEGLPVIRSDRQKVKQILLNLLTNALKFTPRGSVTVSCTHQRADRTISIAVADTGIGIAPADQERIFEAFSQADSTSAREGGGTGLGLAICQRLASVLGGQLTSRARCARAPRSPESSRWEHRGHDEKDQRAGRLPGRRRRRESGPLVLIVDDVQDNRTIYVLFLRFSGFRVVEAENGEEALAKATSLLPDVIVMDLSLPVMDGWEATRRLKRDPRTQKIPVIVLTGHALPSTRRRPARPAVTW
jgi:CheY-like chemotaxis protein